MSIVRQHVRHIRAQTVTVRSHERVGGVRSAMTPGGSRPLLNGPKPARSVVRTPKPPTVAKPPKPAGVPVAAHFGNSFHPTSVSLKPPKPPKMIKPPKIAKPPKVAKPKKPKKPIFGAAQKVGLAGAVGHVALSLV